MREVGVWAGVTRVTLTVDEAAAALGISRDSFDRHVIGELRVVRVGARILVPLRELERWADRTASRPLEAELERMLR